MALAASLGVRVEIRVGVAVRGIRVWVGVGGTRVGVRDGGTGVFVAVGGFKLGCGEAVAAAVPLHATRKTSENKPI